MEAYRGIKFCIEREAEEFPYDWRLSRLDRWIFVFGELGLAPVHSQGAFGNHSYRQENETFIITCTGMVPGRTFEVDRYCRVRPSLVEETFTVEGSREPSSECYLHSLIYQSFPEVGAVMHGHSSLLTDYGERLGLAVTDRELPYGTRELGRTAVDLLAKTDHFIILKDHGFVAVGPTIDETAFHVLRHYRLLLDLLPDLLAGEDSQPIA